MLLEIDDVVVFINVWVEPTDSPIPEEFEVLDFADEKENCLPKNVVPALVMPLTVIPPMPPMLPMPVVPLLLLILPVKPELVTALPVRDVDSLAALPRFLFANSYISPKIPANVLRKFFIVSSASSTTLL